MDIASPMKPNVMTPVDYSKRRHQPEKDDLELSAAGQALLASIEESARPKELAAAFPRISGLRSGCLSASLPTVPAQRRRAAIRSARAQG